MAAAPSSIEQRAARRIGAVLKRKYRIVGVLGAGGMATVYAAIHRNGSRVAIKVLHEELSFRSDTQLRFLREGYVANRVGHPGAVRVLDDDVAEDGAAFLVMELLQGESLRSRAHRAGGTLPWREVAALARQLLDVLAAAHAKGVVHRDIKPDNLFLTTDRVLKVLDFGIARVEDELGAHATATGTRLGTPAFMPPELALGRTRDIDARTDLWCAGATMFTLISGRTVHEAETVAELVVRAATTPARSLGSVAASAPPEVVALVDRALGFHREDRWPSAAAMIEAIDQAAGGPPGPDAIGPVPEGAPASAAEPSGVVAVGSASTTLPQTSAGPAGSAPTRGSTADQHATTQEAAPASPETLRDELTDRGVTTPAIETDPPAPRRSIDTERPATLSPVPTDAPIPSPPDTPPRRRPARPAALLAAAIVALGVAAIVLARRQAGGPAAASPTAAAPGPQCTTSAECVTRGGGAPALCRKEDGVCVALAPEGCRVLAEPGDVGNDATVWIGALWPYRMPDPWHHGRTSANAVDLARREIAQATGGLPPARPGGPRRPLGVVLCDDQESPERAAAHLVDEVRVPAVLGFATSKEVLDLAPSLLMPRGVLTIVATGAATTIRAIPQRPDEPRLVWRVTVPTDALSWPFAAVVEKVLEPELRPRIPTGERIRVALLRHDSLVGQTTADSRVRELRWNGKSVAENGDAFLQISRANFIAGGDFTEVNERTARAVAAFRPHIVVDMPPYPALLAAVERAWPADAPHRPRYLTEGTWSDVGEGVVDWGRDALAARVHAVDVVSSGPATLRFALRYNELFTPHVTPATAPAAPYDALYLVAYAAAALGDQPITGRGLASAIARLQPPGEPVEVGQTGLYPGLLALSAGRRIDLQGAGTPLDLDPATGETSGAFALYCFSSPRAGPVHQVESGLTFDAGRRAVHGARRCP